MYICIFVLLCIVGKKNNKGVSFGSLLLMAYPDWVFLFPVGMQVMVGLFAVEMALLCVALLML